jgi:hypothetical protein
MIKLRLKKINKNYAISPVIGIILTVAIVIGISTIIYGYANDYSEDLGSSATAYMSISAFPSHDSKTSAILNIDKSVDKDIYWNEITWTLVDITEAKELEDGVNVNVALPSGNSLIKPGQIIPITTADDNYLKDLNEYRFSLYYGKNLIVMGMVSWIQ